MATKTITLDLDAYEALRRRKRRGQSFSDVVKEHFAGLSTGATLRRALEAVDLDHATLDQLDRLVDERGRDSATAADL